MTSSLIFFQDLSPFKLNETETTFVFCGRHTQQNRHRRDEPTTQRTKLGRLRQKTDSSYFQKRLMRQDTTSRQNFTKNRCPDGDGAISANFHSSGIKVKKVPLNPTYSLELKAQNLVPQV